MWNLSSSMNAPFLWWKALETIKENSYEREKGVLSKICWKEGIN